METTNPQFLKPVDALSNGFDFEDTSFVHKKKGSVNPYSFYSALSTSVTDKSMIKRQGFRIGELNFMIQYKDGNELSEIPSIFSVPNAPNWFIGFSNLHGLIIPVFDLKEYFGLSKVTYSEESQLHQFSVNNHKDTEMVYKTKDKKHSRVTGKSNRSMLLVIQHNENATGIIIDGLLERLEYDESCMQSNGLEPSQIETAINGSYLIKDEVWFDINSLLFLNELETSLI